MNADHKTVIDSLETDTIDRLFLELSQVTKAKTHKEIAIQKGIGDARQVAINLQIQIEKCGASEELTRASVIAAELTEKLNQLLP